MAADRFVIVGAGGHAKVVTDVLLASGCNIVGYYDDASALAGTEPAPGIRVVGDTSRLEPNWKSGMLAIVAVGDNRTRRALVLRLDVTFGAAVAPSAVVGSRVSIGCGSMILPSATVNVDTVVGRHVILNTSCSVDHDCRIGDFAHIAPGCHLGGNVVVGEGSFLGVGANVIPRIRIGRWAVVGAGAVVTRDLPDNCTAVGVPARVIKTREAGWHLG